MIAIGTNLESILTETPTYRLFSADLTLYRITIEENQLSTEEQDSSIGFVVTLVDATHIIDACSNTLMQYFWMTIVIAILFRN